MVLSLDDDWIPVHDRRAFHVVCTGIRQPAFK